MAGVGVRKAISARTRTRYRAEAKRAGLSLKSYLGSKFQSVGWNCAVEVIRRRCRKSGVKCDLTPALLASLWEEQRGRCPITGWKLERRKSGSGLIPRTTTIDRILPTRGYVPGNLRLVCFQANSYRYRWDDRQMLDFCRAVVRTLGRKA